MNSVAIKGNNIKQITCFSNYRKSLSFFNVSTEFAAAILLGIFRRIAIHFPIHALFVYSIVIVVAHFFVELR
jgi:hypothetical protein